MAMETNTDRLMSDINVTPLVDVMLVLLIIFMVAAPMMMQGVDVALPEATAKPLDSQKENLVITVNKEQQIHISDFLVEPDYLREKLAKILQNRSDREVYFKADKEVPYGVVVKVMAEIKAAGVEKLGMVTVPVEKDQRRDSKK
jgi:biopolymer transport protein TolR